MELQASKNVILIITLNTYNAHIETRLKKIENKVEEIIKVTRKI